MRSTLRTTFLSPQSDSMTGWKRTNPSHICKCIYSTTDGTPHWGGYTYRCYSSADLKEWRDEGDVLNARDGQIHKKKRSALRCPTQCTASAVAARYDGQCSALRHLTDNSVV